MSIRLGYLLPTRERIMAGQPQATPLLELAERAERLGFDSVWAGDSLLARPRHEPLTLLAAVASRVRRVDIGTAVLLPALRNPVLLATRWRLSIRSQKVVSSSASASLPMCLIFARSSLQRVC